MEWYSHLLNPRTAGKPPSYLVERISDLQHASDLAKTSPCEAKLVISRVISQLSDHHDDQFATPLKDILNILHDSPKRAVEAIGKVVATMLAEREDQEAETRDKWTKMKTNR
jgi:hypothetical protein